MATKYYCDRCLMRVPDGIIEKCETTLTFEGIDELDIVKDLCPKCRKELRKFFEPLTQKAPCKTCGVSP